MHRRFLALALAIVGLGAPSASAADLMSFWDEPRFGANSFNVTPPDQAYFEAMAETGATWVRLAFSKWQGEGRDFLIGDADAYADIPAGDLALLERTLDAADNAGIRVVIAPLSLPGARWIQQNDGAFDDRLWSDKAYWEQAARFWSDLAVALRDHPAVAGYNILNEPAPERTQQLPENAPMGAGLEFVLQQQGSARDLPSFYEHVIRAIRTVDPVTPIMVDGGYYANPRNLAAWPAALADDRILYAFHMYEPWAATSGANRRREVPLRYPGVETEYEGGTVTWDREVVSAHIRTAFDWAARQNLPPTRIVASEFGCVRTWEDCAVYLTDVLDAFEANGGHWAFYTFRPDEWDAMDYELPPSVKPGRYYWLMEQGQGDKLPRNGPLMEILRTRMTR